MSRLNFSSDFSASLVQIWASSHPGETETYASRDRKKVVVVTGGASGIAPACCREFAKCHAAVAAVDLEEKAGRRARTEGYITDNPTPGR